MTVWNGKRSTWMNRLSLRERVNLLYDKKSQEGFLTADGRRMMLTRDELEEFVDESKFTGSPSLDPSLEARILEVLSPGGRSLSGREIAAELGVPNNIPFKDAVRMLVDHDYIEFTVDWRFRRKGP